MLSLFLSFDLSANAFVVCAKGKIKIGDSYTKFVDYCGKTKINYKAGGARKLGKKNTLMMFTTFIITYPDKSSLRFVFLDEKLAFIFDQGLMQ